MKYSIEELNKGKQAMFLLLDEEYSPMILPSKYLKHKVNEKCSPNTVKNIAYGLRHYLAFLDVKKVTEADILRMSRDEQKTHFVEFIYWVKDGHHSGKGPVKNNTANTYLEMIFGYYEYIIFENLLPGKLWVIDYHTVTYRGPGGVELEKFRRGFSGYLPDDKGQGEAISEDNFFKVLAACNNLMYRLLFILIGETGYREGEILGIKWAEDIDFERNRIRVNAREDNENRARAKYGANRAIDISETTMKLLRHYIFINQELLVKSEHLFVVQSGPTRGRALTKSAVDSMMRYLQKKTGIKVTTHMVRHYFADVRWKAGWDLEMLRVALGHKSIKTTIAYLHAEQEMLFEAQQEYLKAHEGLYPIDDLLLGGL